MPPAPKTTPLPTPAPIFKPPAAPRPNEWTSLEVTIGAKWFNWVGMILVIVGVMFFLTTLRAIVKFITAFTVGHSITLIGATLYGAQANYFLIDAVIDTPRMRARMSDKPDEFFIKPAAIADELYHLYGQDRSAWSFLAELRPFRENW